MAEVNFTNLVENSQPKRRLTRIGIFILIGVGLLLWSLLVGAGSERGEFVSLMLLWIILIGVLVSIFINAARRQGIIRCSRKAADLCLLERWDEAIEPLQKVLNKPVNQPQIRYQGLLELAGVAEHTGKLDQSRQIYQAIGQEQPHGPLGRLALVGEAIVLLKLDQLADAEAVIRRLEVSVEGPGLKSLVLLARLYQQIKTGHYSEALEDEANKCELARLGLSTKAGYVYGMLALAHKNQTENQDQAKKYWRQATMLIRPENLVRKFPELAQLEQAYPSANGLPEAPEVK
ncbi:MAG: hypothetical protein GWP14_04500 [Actinobacteria bacterium]|nr:hypothetical protein [Actinomycetota bacterium]